MEEEKLICGLGANQSPIDLRDYTIVVPNSFVPPNAYEIPRFVGVKNQGQVNSCVAHALASTIEYFNMTQNRDLSSMSVGYIYGNRRNTEYKDKGMYVREALAAILKDGDVYEDDFAENVEVPECVELFDARYETLKSKGVPHRISAYYKLKDKREMQYSLLYNGPIVFSINWYSDMTVDKNGVLRSQRRSKDYTGGHCMVIYGWNEQGWLFQNSWGRSWGKKGRAILPFDAPLKESWGVLDTLVEGSVKKPFGAKILKWVAKCINFILNLFRKDDDN